MHLLLRRFLLSLLLAFFALFIAVPVFAGDCSRTIPDDNNWNIANYLKWCAPDGSVKSENDDYTIEGGVKTKVTNVTNQLILIGSILSVGGIVFAAFLYVSAVGDAEGVKKAKTALKFSIVGFIVMLLSFPIVNAIVNLIYGIGK